MGFFDYTDPETLSGLITSITIGALIVYIWATLRNRREVPLKAKSRVDKLLAMGETDALADIIANETDTYICLLAAEALVELGDERGKNLLDSPIGETLTAIPEPAKYGLGLRLMTTIGVFFITWLVLWALLAIPLTMMPSLIPLTRTPFVLALFWGTPLAAGYIAYRWGWRNKYFISK